MNEKLRIFLMFFACWSILRAMIFVFLSLKDLSDCLSSFKKFLTYIGMLVFGIVVIPFSTLFDCWWFLLFLTFMYFLFGGGTIVFVILVIGGIALINLPNIAGMIILLKSKDKK